MSTDEVNARRCCAAIAVEDVWGSGQALSEFAYTVSVSSPEVPYVIAEPVVPFAPAVAEPAKLIAVRSEIPRLGDHLDLAQHRILTDRDLERVVLVDVMALVRSKVLTRSKRKPSTPISVTQ